MMLQKYFLYLMLLLLVFACSNNPSSSKKETNPKPDTASVSVKSTEDFNDFFILFSKNEKFQLERILYPFPHFSLDSVENIVCDTLKQGQWQYVDLLPNGSSFTSIYDNFKHELRATDERVFALEGVEVEDEGGTYYYFKRINGLWYLIKREDFSY